MLTPYPLVLWFSKSAAYWNALLELTVNCDVAVLNGAPIDTSPLFLITNFVEPLLLAVKMSPRPDWSPIRLAFVVAPDIEAIGFVAPFPRTSRVARGEVDPIPKLPFSSKRATVLSPIAFRVRKSSAPVAFVVPVL